MAVAVAGTLGDASVPLGTDVHSVHETELDLDLHIRHGRTVLERPIRRRHRQVTKVEPVAGGFAIHWAVNRHQALEPGHEHDRPLAVEGRRYLVTNAIRRDDGQTPAAAEVDVVRQVDVLGMLRAMREMLGPAPEVGVPCPAGPMFAGLIADAPGEPRVSSGTVTWVRSQTCAGRPCAAVALELRLVSEGVDDRGATVVTRAHARGEALLEVETGWTRAFHVVGSVDVVATRPGLHTTGQGTFRVQTTLDYAPGRPP